MQISRHSFTLLAGAAASALILSACGGGSSTPAPQAQAALTVAAASTTLDPSGTTVLSSSGGNGTGLTTYNATGACTVSGTTLTASSTSSGACTVTATKAADATYSAITSSALTVTVRAPQAPLTVAAASTSLSAGGTTNLSTTGGSGAGAVTYQVTAGGCTVNAAAVLTAPAAVATCTVTATKAADGSSYSQAVSTNTLSITVVKNTLVNFSETRAAASFLIPFEGLSATSAIATDPADSSNKAAKLVKVASGQPWAGATVSTCDYPANGTAMIPFTASVTKLSMRVYGPASVKYRLKLEDAAGTTPLEQDATSSATANTWQELTFDFKTPLAGTFDATKKWSKVSVFPAFLSAVTADTTYYVDDIKVVGVQDLSLTCQTAPVEPAPSAAATVPDTTARPQAKVIAIYSDSYNQPPGLDFPTWGSPTIVAGNPFGANNTLKLGGLTYNGVTWTTEIDVSTFTNLHVDFWSTDATSVDVFLISKNAVEEKVTVALTANVWTPVDKLMSGFTTVDKTKIYQIKLVANPSGKTVFMDNLYFWKP